MMCHTNYFQLKTNTHVKLSRQDFNKGWKVERNQKLISLKQILIHFSLKFMIEKRTAHTFMTDNNLKAHTLYPQHEHGINI